jgi:hypothetical protein
MAFPEDRLPEAAESCSTPFGVLYRPRSFGVQIPVLIGAFAGGPVAGWILGRILGGVSDNGQVFLYISTTSIFFFGYALWAARLASLAFNAFGKQILWLLFQWIVKRKKPQSPEELLPTREKLEELVVRAQRAAWSFLVVSVAVGLICGALAQLIETQNGKLEQSVIVAAGCILWGWILGSLGRRGYLPLPEAD